MRSSFIVILACIALVFGEDTDVQYDTYSDEVDITSRPVIKTETTTKESEGSGEKFLYIQYENNLQ